MPVHAGAIEFWQGVEIRHMLTARFAWSVKKCPSADSYFQFWPYCCGFHQHGNFCGIKRRKLTPLKVKQKEVNERNIFPCLITCALSSLNITRMAFQVRVRINKNTVNVLSVASSSEEFEKFTIKQLKKKALSLFPGVNGKF